MMTTTTNSQDHADDGTDAAAITLDIPAARAAAATLVSARREGEARAEQAYRELLGVVLPHVDWDRTRAREVAAELERACQSAESGATDVDARADRRHQWVAGS